MEKSYLLGERICLRAVEPEDLELLYRIENDPSLWEISNFTVPYSRFALKQYIENAQNDVYVDKQIRMMIVRHADKKVLGSIDMTDFVALHSRATIGIALLNEYRSDGYGKEALGLICAYAFDFLHFKQLYVQIPVDNEASIALFASCGFVRCGLLKDWLRVGDRYKDVVMMQCIKNISLSETL